MIQENKIYNVDCEKGIVALNNNSIDLVVTSPPYNVNLGNNKYNKNPYILYKDNKNHDEYIEWLKGIFKLLYPKIKVGGRLCINIGNGENGKIPTVSDIIQVLSKDLNYLPFAQIVWDKGHTSARTAWGSWQSPSSPSFPTPFEFILVFAKESLKLKWKGETDLTKDEFKEWAYGLWKFKPETRKNDLGHPAPFPIELPKRCIKMFSWKNSVVLDPFMGSGTTAIACKKFNRDYIGFEIDKHYYELSKKRLKEV